MLPHKDLTKYWLYLIISIFQLCIVLHAQQLAFPSAVGAAATEVTGGRGGQVIHVTNLNDSGEGSFREALESAGTRTIVFDVSGVINITSDIYVTDPNFTVAGQSAPFGGITLIGTFSLRVQTENWIFRYIRFRSGYDESNIDGGWVNTTSSPSTRNADNFIIDHCSGALSKETAGMAGGQTETVDNPTLTSQNNLLAENDRGTLVGDSNDSDPSTVTVYRNGYINSGWRFPKGGGDIDLDVINTYVYNWEFRAINMDEHNFKLNIINNVYQAGQGTRLTDNAEILFTVRTSSTMSPQIWDEGTLIIPEIYNGGANTYDPTPIGYPSDLSLAWDPFHTSTFPIQASWFSSSRLPLNGLTPDILPSNEVKDYVLENSGANKYFDDNGIAQVYRDVIDNSAINVAKGLSNSYTIDGTTYTFGSRQKLNESDYEDIAYGLINDTPSNTRPSGFYQSNPHIPEAWLVANGYTGSPTIHNEIEPDGYTVLEHYLNQVDGPPPGNVDATGVTLTPDVASINISETLSLNTQFTPVNTTDQTGVWTSENDAIASVDGNGLVTGNSEGSIEIRFVSNDGGFTATSQITVIPLPLIANAGDDQTICEGQEIQLTAEEAPSYLWSTGETTQSINVSPIITTTYTLTVTDGNSTEIDEVTVFVDSLPDLTVSEDVSIVEGDNIELSATGANTYLWSTGETTSSINVSPLETTTYNVIGTNGVCEVSENVTVTVEPLLNVDLGDDQQICEGSGESIILDAGNGDSYLWNTGETTQTISVDPVSTSTYSVTVTSGTQQDTDSITIFVDPNPNVVILNGDSVDILNGDFVTLSATGANTYEWNNGATQPNIAVSPSQTTVYEVRGYINECYDEKQVVVNVIPEVEADAGDDVEICLGETVILIATGGDEYAWSNGEITQSIEVSPIETTEYTVTVFNALDFDEDSVVVNVISDCEESIEEPDPTISSDEPFEFTFDVFPNPTSNYVDVRIAGIENLARIYIYDMMGKLIYQKRIQNGSANVSSISRFDMSKLIPGIYYIQFQNLEKTMTKKLLVQ